MSEHYSRKPNFDSEFNRKFFKTGNSNGPTTSGKTYILKSIVDGLMNSGTIRTEKSDSFCFGSCADKSMIYTGQYEGTNSPR